MSILSYGVKVGIRATTREALENISQYLPPEWKPSGSKLVQRIYSIVAGGPAQRLGVRRFNLLYEDHVRIGRALDPNLIYGQLETSLRIFVAEFAPRRVFIHAGVVGWKGVAIIIPGRSFSGKTTLVKELVRRGASYYSDEYAVLDGRGRVHPFAKSLSIRSDGEFEQKDYRVQDLGGIQGTKPLNAALVVLTSYKPQARWRPRHVSPGQGALALLDNAVAARRSPERVFAALQPIVSAASVLKGVRGDARAMAESILEYVDRKRLSVPLAAYGGKLGADRLTA